MTAAPERRKGEPILAYLARIKRVPIRYEMKEYHNS